MRITKKRPKQVRVSFLKKKPQTPRKRTQPVTRSRRLKTSERAKMPLRKFCGKYGGADPRSFPVDTPGRAKIAIAYAYKAPNPQGIVDCAKRALARMKKQGMM